MSTSTKLMTADELSDLPDSPFRHELVKGELLTMSLPGEEHGAVSANLTFALIQYVKTNKVGVVYTESGFKLESDPDTVLGPDIAFIRRERVGIVSKRFRQGAPDLAVEVISPNQRPQNVKWKTEQWLQHGARSVWNVNPQTKTVSVHRDNGEVKHFEGADILTDDLLPGFRISLTEIFSVGNF